MIDSNSLTAWGMTAPWANVDQIEQDLLLSRVLIEISNYPGLREELIFRGGTCLHKLHLKQAFRYSEDLDFVRNVRGSNKQMLSDLRNIGESLGFDVSIRQEARPKIYFRTSSQSGAQIKLKLEIESYESIFAFPLIRKVHQVSNLWFSGSAEVLTFEPAELMATKIRALYSRNKGRDIFDIWLGLNELKIEPARILEACSTYNFHFTSAEIITNVREKLGKAEFRNDLSLMVRQWPTGYNIDTAADQIATEILNKLG